MNEADRADRAEAEHEYEDLVLETFPAETDLDSFFNKIEDFYIGSNPKAGAKMLAEATGIPVKDAHNLLRRVYRVG